MKIWSWKNFDVAKPSVTYSLKFQLNYFLKSKKYINMY